MAPWRGFATGGYTRAMAQYNWYANTKSTMVQVDYDFGKAGVVQDFKVSARYAMQDFDDKKPGVQADSNILHVDMIKKVAEGLEMKVRVGLVDADDDIVDMNGATKTSPITHASRNLNTLLAFQTDRILRLPLTNQSQFEE